ncbi:hypothetical protein BJ878DRAFT_567987 [Calycina marina]|uniref:Acyclic terpene utilisation N-terminal domain-containing protein n=1 Tax=Calycina marina TaxID=1763456 RepID=A0A9P8CED1_9HELO|nr:hypothetical protein BJ878DRAFT_567987 [Calycina marina]
MLAENFIDCFVPAILYLLQNKIKLAVNDCASDTEVLSNYFKKLCEEAGFPMKVAWVEGDGVTEVANKLIDKGEKFESLMHEKALEELKLEPLCAQACVGGLGIAEALRHDLIECASYVCGGYFSGFKDMLKQIKNLNVGFPIAEFHADGSRVIIKENNGGIIIVGSVSSQLLYQIQGPLYCGSDVVAHLEGIKIEQVGEYRVRIIGFKGPSTNHQHRWNEDQIRESLDAANIAKFSLLKFHVNVTSPLDARNQDAATVDFRVFAQSRDRELLRRGNPRGFFRLSMVTFLKLVHGASLGNDMPQAEGTIDSSSARRRRHSGLWAGLRHCGFDDVRFYNSLTQAEIHSGKTSKLGMHVWNKQGIVGCGVLIDFVSYDQKNGTKYDTASFYAITLPKLEDHVWSNSY